VSVQTEKSRIVARVSRAIADWKVSDGLDASLFRSFAETIVDRIRGPFLAQHPPRAVLRFLETAFRFALDRRQGELHVAVTEGGRGLVVQTHMDDQPFIVDTTRLFLKRHGAEYWGGFHVIVRVRRDEQGTLLAVGDDEPLQEALALMEVGEGDLGADLTAAGAKLHEHLTMAKLAVGDFRVMTRTVDRFRERCESLADRRPDQAEVWNETASFLAWLNRENFVFMGMVADGKSFGIETVDGPYRSQAGSENDAAPWKATHPPGTVFVRKAQTESPIHRAGRVDEVRVVVGEGDDRSELFIRGLFTYRAVTQPSRNVPILSKVLKAELERQESVPGSFRYKGIGNVFDSLPTEFLFVTPAEAISEMIELVLDSEQQQEVGVTLLRYEDGSAFCLLTMPKEQFSDELRREIELEMERALGATYTDHGLFIGRFDTVLLHYFLTGVAAAEDATVQALTERIRSLATPWESALWQVFARDHGDERADSLVDRFGRGFPADWRRRTSAERAASDIIMLDRLGDDGMLADVFEDDGVARLRVYQSRDANLTDILPVLGNFGLTVIRSEAVEIDALGGKRHIDTFDLAFDDEGKARFFEQKDLFVAALPEVFAKRVEDDVLNALVIQSGLAWDQVDVLRGYVHYLRQLQFSLPAPRVRHILLSHPVTCGALFALFDARFNVALADRDAAVVAAESNLDGLMRLIQTHDEDQALNAVAGLIRATIRTNHYRTDRVSHYLSFKFECAKIREMKPEKPLFEIYVHSREVEGVHLRFGKVARGGLRWSDRADYRTEVLGLVTTQQVKNVVIVPEGSKGGFYLHYPDPDRGVQRAQADRLYRTFIRGLLDLTDNVRNGEQLRPPNVVCHDAFDPYLVVAADKGTAHLSDTANSLSEAYGFWLGDAFASGGSNGYDHKKVGITARGGWVLVKRHFAEMGKDPYRETITAIGVGDMSGDVFGNGLIETPHIKLFAAFNHIHIFIDPDPDPQRSFDERLRLFKAERNGGWNNYDKAVISEGGGVYDRTAKSIPLSPQAAALLGLRGESADPETVISAILKMDVDLFWSGGIGTYVKATRETQEDADDRTNDRCRVNASELRCKVVGEGANLSFTQAARIEAGLRGVLLNTDFIDNSAGVDLSDHEVNLKILLSAAVTRGDLTNDARNALLVALTDEVARLVLVDNDTQGRQISRDRMRSSKDIFPFGRAIAFIERHFNRTRASFQLPTDELLGERADAGLGLSRPELSTLSAHVKRWVYAELLASGQARQLTGYKDLLHKYFPADIQVPYRKDIEAHQLADEIAMTGATTRVVGDAGAAFVPLAVESTGRSVFAVVDTYLRAQKLARAHEVRATLEELRASVRLEALTRAWVQVDAGCRDVAMFWLSSGTRPPTDAELEEMGQAVHEVYALQADDVAQRNAAIVEKMRQDDIPEGVARAVLEAQYLNIALMVWWHAKKLGISFRETVIRELAAGRASRLQEIIEALGRRPTSGQWEPIAMRVLVNRFTDRLRQLVLKVGTTLPANSVDELEPLLVAGPLADVRAQVDRLVPRNAPLDLPALIVLEERLDGAIRRIGA
jgi:glutamate dehydrogenase